MAPHFRRHDESVEAGFRRIAVAEIEAAIAIIDASGPADADKVHKVRRQMKALRGLLRLMRPGFARFRKENRIFRDIARSFSGMRDARVMLDTFDKITARPDGQPLRAGFQAVRERLLAARDAHGDAASLLANARRALVKARDRAQGWALSEGGWALLAEGLERTYDHARTAMRETMASGDAEAGHEWRKSVKYHGAQAQLLRRMKPGRLKADMKASARLADLLGERHDIDLFLDHLAATPARFGDIVTVTQLAALARLRIARLERRAERLGEKLFADKPGKLADRWGDWWQDWRGANA